MNKAQEVLSLLESMPQVYRDYWHYKDALSRGQVKFPAKIKKYTFNSDDEVQNFMNAGYERVLTEGMASPEVQSLNRQINQIGEEIEKLEAQEKALREKKKTAEGSAKESVSKQIEDIQEKIFDLQDKRHAVQDKKKAQVAKESGK